MKRETEKIKLMPKDVAFCRNVNRLSLCIMVLTGLYLFFTWGDIPDPIPVHYNFAGEPDRYDSKDSSIILPIIGVLTYLLMTVVDRLPLSMMNTGVRVTEENKGIVYSAIKRLLVTEKLAVVVIFCWITVTSTSGYALGIWFAPVMLIGVFLPIVIYLLRVTKKHS